MATKKTNILLIAGLAVAAYYLYKQSKGPRVSVTADSPEIQSADQYEGDYQEAQAQTAAAPATPLQAITSAVSKLFPKKSKEQKAAKKSARVAKRAARKASKKVAGFDDISVLY